MELIDIWLAKPKICKQDRDIEFLSGFVDNIPVVFSKRQYEEENIISVLSRMPFKCNKNPWNIRKVKSQTIDDKRLSPICSSIVVTKEKLSFWDMYLATVNCDDKTFIFDDFDVFFESFKNISKITNEYKYKTLFQNKDNFDYVLDLLSYKTKQILFTISIYNLKNFCPIFNLKKVDGLGIAVEIIDSEQTAMQGYPISVQNVYTIMSNYKDNVFYMDGVNIQSYDIFFNLDYFNDQYAKISKNYNKIKNKHKNTDTLKIKSKEKRFKFPYPRKAKISSEIRTTPLKAEALEDDSSDYATQPGSWTKYQDINEMVTSIANTETLYISDALAELEVKKYKIKSKFKKHKQVHYK